MNKIYYRKSLMDADELSAASKYFDCVDLLSDIESDELIIPRYSLFPFALDQEREVLNLGSRFINTYGQHRYVADLQNYVYDLKELTPLTWDRIQDLPNDGPFILKGETNSRKNKWLSNMFAETKKEAIDIYGKLCDDPLIGDQKIYIRQYVPLKSYFTGIGGVPISEEYRFFACYGEILCGGFYWQNYADEFSEIPDHNNVPREFLNEVLRRINNQINFVVIDVAKTQAGDWTVIELNDGQCSGLSCNDPDELYGRLKFVIENKNVRSI